MHSAGAWESSSLLTFSTFKGKWVWFAAGVNLLGRTDRRWGGVPWFNCQFPEGRPGSIRRFPLRRIPGETLLVTTQLRINSNESSKLLIIIILVDYSDDINCGLCTITTTKCYFWILGKEMNSVIFKQRTHIEEPAFKILGILIFCLTFGGPNLFRCFYWVIVNTLFSVENKMDHFEAFECTYNKRKCKKNKNENISVHKWVIENIYSYFYSRIYK